MYKFSENIRIADRLIGDHHPLFIIAEAGVSHFGSLEKAKRLVDLAVEAKADAVKFQIYRTEELISKESFEWIGRLKTKELPFEAFHKIKSYCESRGIIFFATAHDKKSLECLDDLDVPVYKIGSGEIDNWSFLKLVASRGKPVILSTGMYTMKKISQALDTFMEVDVRDIALLHCVTQYPTPPQDVNLRAMESIRKKFNIIVGYSDHTEGYHFPLVAAALRASIIEKHISLDFNVPNAQDWKVSCGPEDFCLMVKQIREIEEGMGSGIKKPGRNEMKSIAWARKSLIAADEIVEGETITHTKIAFKRPGTGIPPCDVDKVIGKKATKTIHKDMMIKWEDIN